MCDDRPIFEALECGRVSPNLRKNLPGLLGLLETDLLMDAIEASRMTAR